MMYLEIIVEAELAGSLPTSGCRSAGSEVVAELTGRISAVWTIDSHVTLDSCGIPHDASTFQQIHQYIRETQYISNQNDRGFYWSLPAEMATPMYTRPVMRIANSVPLGMAIWGSLKRNQAITETLWGRINMWWGTLTARSPEMLAPAKMPVAAGKKMEKTEKNVSPRKSGPKFSAKMPTKRTRHPIRTTKQEWIKRKKLLTFKLKTQVT